jgi:pyruvate dehydrogenase E2 component (dihydrolipoamide acetyltransferase)
MTAIVMPQLSDSMQEGTILRWLIADGAPVARGEELLEIETDKATMTYESEVEGILEVVTPDGATVPVGEVIARLGDGSRVAPVSDAGASAPAGDLASAGAAGLFAPAGDLVSAGAAGLSAPATAPRRNGSNGGGDRAAAPAVALLATPVARRLADAHGVALAQIAGTGPRGRITKADVAQAAGIETAPRYTTAAPAPPAVPAAPDAPSPGPTEGGAKGSTTVEELSRLQQLIARRMAQAKATVPHFQVQTEAIMDEAIALRSRLKALADPTAPTPSFNDIIIKACAIALRQHPRVNGSYEDGRFELHSRVNIGFAVAADDALIVPTLFDADLKSLGTIATESGRLAERVRSGAITPPELSGGTFTVSNLGMYGMTAITPVINPPQAAILGVGALREVLTRVDGEIVDRTLMTFTLSCDHRILYGADAARFLGEIKALLQAPLRILL